MFRFILTRRVIENFKKIEKKIQKIKKISLWILFNPKYIEGQEREKIKVIVSIRSYPTRNRKFQKNRKKNRKNKKNTFMDSFQSIIHR